MTAREEQEEKKNRRVAMLSTAGIQVVVLLVLFFLVAWRAPDPPLPEYGIELNFGLDTEGYGDVQPEEPVGNEGKEKEKPAQEKPKEDPQPEETQEDPVEEIKTQPQEQAVVSKLESPVTVKEKKEEIKPIEKPVVEKPVEEKKPEPKKEEPKAVFKPAESTTTTNEGGSKEGKPGNHGDDKGKTGDKGNPEGKLDAKALYGQGGGGGGGVSMSGFNGFDWPKVESPSLPDDAYGVYEFLVKVDDQGDVISVTPIQRGLSLEAERKLKAVIQQLVFVPKGANLPPHSEGKITFRVVSK